MAGEGMGFFMLAFLLAVALTISNGRGDGEGVLDPGVLDSLGGIGELAGASMCQQLMNQPGATIESARYSNTHAHSPHTPHTLTHGPRHPCSL